MVNLELMRAYANDHYTEEGAGNCILECVVEIERLRSINDELKKAAEVMLQTIRESCFT